MSRRLSDRQRCILAAMRAIGDDGGMSRWSIGAMLDRSSPATIPLPAMHALERRGLVEVSHGRTLLPAADLWRLSDAGRAELAAMDRLAEAEASWRASGDR